MQTELLTNTDAGDESTRQDPDPVGVSHFRGPDAVRGPAESYPDDLKIFWGPEFCRLDYALHLLDTGRIHGN
jgi:hypothetical protein